MSVLFDEAVIKKIEEIAHIVQMEGCSDYLTSRSDQERWINFFGITACYINQKIALLKTSDMEVSMAPICLANDNTGDDEGELSPEISLAIQFHMGSVDNLIYWHKEITSFMPSTQTTV